MATLKTGRQDRSSVMILVESAILISVATVLSLIPLTELPYGGSITLASMMPILLISYRNGIGWGLGSGLVYAVIQQLLGLKNLSYVTTWQSVLAVILLDYVLAFVVIGLAGIFRRVIRRQNVAMIAGGLLVCVLRYLCHVVSGATVWAGLSIPNSTALASSFIYNATYMAPETIVLLIAVGYLSTILDFRRDIPTRLKRTESEPPYPFLGGFFAAVALIVMTAILFKHMQDDTGFFDHTLLATVHWVPFSIAVGLLLLAAAVFFILAWRYRKSHAGQVDKTGSDRV